MKAKKNSKAGVKKLKNIHSIGAWLLVIGLATALLLTATWSPISLTTKNSPSEEFFYVQTAASGELKATERDRTFELTLGSVNPGVVYFSDRPERDTGNISNQEMVDEVFTDKVAPNATLTFEDSAGQEKRVVLELFDPQFEDNKASYTVKYLGDTAPKAQSFKNVELFIDSHRNYDQSCSVGVYNGSLMYLDADKTSPYYTGDHWMVLPTQLSTDYQDYITVAWHSDNSTFSYGGGYHADAYYKTASGRLTARIHIHCDIDGVQSKNTFCTYTLNGKEHDCYSETGYLDQDKTKQFTIPSEGY